MNAPLQSEIEPDSEQTFEGIDDKTIQWQEALTEADGFLDLRKYIQANSIVVGYAFTYVYAPKTTESVLMLGSDDTITIWLNGAEIHRNDISRPTLPDQHAIPCQLKAGWNTVLCKTSLIGGYWGFYLRFTDADRVLRYSPYPMESIGER